MKPLVVLFQMGARDMGVNLGRRNICVPEHLLNRANISVILHQMSRKRVPQSVRRNTFQATFIGVLCDRNINDLPVDRRACSVYEHIVDLDIFFFSPHSEIAFDPFDR